MNSSGKLASIAFCVLCGFFSQTAFGYETPVHSKMTEAAFNQAVKEHNFLSDLGVRHYFDASGNLFFSENLLGLTPLQWTQFGSVAEDNIPRSKNHFFDPTAQPAVQGFKGLFQSAPDHALDATDNPTYSIPGTRNSLYNALTSTDPFLRPKFWRDTFRGVGQFTHLLQDMAQPQHVRDDNHFSLTENFYYLFPDYSRYEKRTLWLSDPNQNKLQYTGYPTVKLPSYRTFWASDANIAGNIPGSGLAEFTNANFVSEHTNLDNTKYNSPSGGTFLKEEVVPQVNDVENNPIPGATNVTIQYLANTYTDKYANASNPNNRLSTYSIFDFQSMQTVGKHVFSLYNTNFETYAGILVPRAVGYSAGLINYFFRGQMEITPPAEGVYGIVDHSTIHQTDPLAGFAGFNTIKLKLRNITPNNEAMSGGTLIAVAKFRRNGCYKDDLTGEFQTLTPPCQNYRTAPEEIVLSNQFTNVSLDTVTPQQYTFTFANAIPINATDLYLQVVYRGPLGTNEPDAVVVATKDVFEPTYITLLNSTDYLLYNNAFVLTTDPALLPTLAAYPGGPLSPAYDKTPLNFSFGFVDLTQPLGNINNMPPGRFSRLALLTGRSPYDLAVEAKSQSGYFYFADITSYGAETNQLDPATGIYRVSEFSLLRGVPVWGSATYFRYYPSFNTADLTTMLPLANTSPYPVTNLNFK